MPEFKFKLGQEVRYSHPRPDYYLTGKVLDCSYSAIAGVNWYIIEEKNGNKTAVVEQWLEAMNQ